MKQTDLSSAGGSGKHEHRNLQVPQTQHARFLETARALGCDEDEAAFDEKLKVVAGHKPKGEAKPPQDTKP